MMGGVAVRKCAVLADPRDPVKARVIQKAMLEIQPALEKQGIEVISMVGYAVEFIKPDPDTDLFLVLGGDGTMIHFAARLSNWKIPFYGLNYGNVGFMMNGTRGDLERHARNIAEGTFIMWEFPVLYVRSIDLHGTVHEGFGLNDIYLQRMTPQSCKVNITIASDALNINPVLCDGLIVSTPLGSTAYSFNVTGMIAAIHAPVISLTPVAASRTCPISSMVLPEDTLIKFDVLEPEKRKVQVVTDGQSHGGLLEAEVRISDNRVRLCFEKEYSDNLPIRFINKACVSPR